MTTEWRGAGGGWFQVNLDDELYVREDGVELDHTQLAYDEFQEVLVRVCDAKVPL